MRKLLLLAGVLFLLAGCTAIGIHPPHLIRTAGQKPQFNEENSASAGSTLFSQWKLASQKTATPSQDVSLGGKSYIPAGTTFYNSDSDYKSKSGNEEECYCTGQSGMPFSAGYPMFGNGVSVSMSMGGGICLFSDDGKNFTQFQFLNSLANPSPINAPVPFTTTETTTDGFKYELVFNGITDNALKFTLTMNTAGADAPSKIQELSYPIGALPMTLGIKGSKIEVLAVHDNTITYKVLSGFFVPPSK